MTIKRPRRGAALVWAILLTFVVTVAVGTVGSGLSDRARVVRQVERHERLEALEVAARSFAGARLAQDALWKRPERVDLAGGSFLVWREGDGAGIHMLLTPAGGGERAIVASLAVVRRESSAGLDGGPSSLPPDSK